MLPISRKMKSCHPVVKLLIFGTILISSSSSMSIVYLPLYLIHAAQLNPIKVGLIVGAGSLSAMIGGFLGGTLSDLLGRKRLMLSSLALLGTVFVGLILTSHPLILLILNILRGLFSSFFLTISKALMADLTPKDERVRVFSKRYMAGNIGYSIGPLIGTFLGIVGNKLAFLLTALVYFGCFFIMSLVIRHNKITEGEKREDGSFCDSWNVFRKDKVLFLYIFGSILLTTVHGEMSVTLSQYIRLNMSNGIKLFGYLISINGITVILTQIQITRWSEKFGTYSRIVIGSSLFAIGEIGFAFSNNDVEFILSMIVFTFGEIFIIPAEYAQIDQITPEGMRGMYYGAQGFSEIGNFIGPWFGGLILQTYSGRTMFLTMAVFCIISMFVFAQGNKLSFKKGTLINSASIDS